MTRLTTKKNLPVYFGLGIAAIVFVFPVYWIIVSSLKSDFEMSLIPPTLFPREIRWENFINIIERIDFLRVFGNSMYQSVTVTLLVLIFSSMAAYVLAKKKLFIGKVYFTTLLATMLVPPTVLILPLFFIINAVGLVNTLEGLIIPFSVSSFSVIFMRQYLLDLPDSFLEAAKIDGANEFYIFFRIVLPLAKPALATLATVEFINNWNSFTVPLIILKDPQIYTLPLKLSSVLTAADIMSWSATMAGNVLAIVPTIILFLAVQKWFVNGIAGGIKS
jgi:ABC-type glycerol-3-phosphate transport system permease component